MVEFKTILRDLKEAVSEPRTPANVRQAVLSGVKQLTEFLDHADEEGPEIDGCPDCGAPAAPEFRVTQLIPAVGWQAVFAESDSKDPLSMSVETVVGFAVLEFPDGFSCMSGMFSCDESIMPCFTIGSFVGYVPPGKNPDMFADKVREKFKEMRDNETSSPD